MFYLKLAARNVFRQWGRTGLSMVSIVAGVAVIILGRGFVGGSKENIVRAQIDSVSGHVLARPADYPTVGVQHPVDTLLSLPADTDAWLAETAEAFTRRTLFTARVVRGRESLRVRVYGFDPDTDEGVFPRGQWKVKGTLPGAAGEGVAVSTGLARIFEVAPGGALVFQARTADGAINALELPVSAVVSTGNPGMDRLGVLMPMPLVQRLILSGERFSHLAVRLKQRDETDTVASALQARLGEAAEVTTWHAEAASMLELQEIRQAMLDLIAFVLMAIAAAGIANTVLMAAYERVREIGTLRAMGLTRRGVVGLFVAEGALTGVVGATVGGVLGALVVHKYAVDGIDLSPMIESAGSTGAYENVPMSAMLYLQDSPTSVAVAVVFGVVVAVLASVYPAFVATKLTPAEAVRAS